MGQWQKNIPQNPQAAFDTLPLRLVAFASKSDNDRSGLTVERPKWPPMLS